jgi:hypothetical protein
MKRISILLLVFGLTALGTRAQTVTGSGTTNTIPQFTSSTTIGDSPLLQFDGTSASTRLIRPPNLRSRISGM